MLTAHALELISQQPGALREVGRGGSRRLLACLPVRGGVRGQRRALPRQLSRRVLCFYNWRDHVHFILRTCNPPRARSGKIAAALGPAQVSAESARYEHPPSVWLGSFHIPKPRRAAARGSAFPRSDIENASAAQIPCLKIPPGYRPGSPGSSANLRPHPRRYSGPALSEVPAPAVERLLHERVIPGSRKAS